MSKMPVNKKSVVCLETGESFNSLREAADAVGISYQCISRAARLGSRQMDCISILQVRRNRKSLSLSRVIGEDGEKRDRLFALRHQSTSIA